MPKPSKTIMRRRALLIEQDPEHPLYLLSLSGEELLALAEVSRVSRDDAGKLIGYQRPEVRRHIEDIVDYLNGNEVIFPNSIILALSSKARFVRSRGPQIDDGVVSSGTLEIPLPRAGEPKPAWIVDGQQRTVALTRSKRASMRVPVNAFIADDVPSQRDQFLRINNTKPLPRGLITELLPEVTGILPAKLAARRIPSALTEELATREQSPFFELIRRASQRGSKKDKAVVADTSIVKMIEESLTTPSGCLFPYRNVATGEVDDESLWLIVVVYWQAVKNVFPEAWGKDPARSRLMHGVGIRSMGRLMDKVMPTVDFKARGAVARAQHEIALVAQSCHWTSGRWEELGDLAWNELQNVPRHIRALSNLLLRVYIRARVHRS